MPTSVPQLELLNMRDRILIHRSYLLHNLHHDQFVHIPAMYITVRFQFKEPALSWLFPRVNWIYPASALCDTKQFS